MEYVFKLGITSLPTSTKLHNCVSALRSTQKIRLTINKKYEKKMLGFSI